jgi:hypothetical protein
VKFFYHQEPSTPGAAHKDRTNVLRPRIRVRLFNKNRFIHLLALVDSGADDCLFPLEVATELNLPLNPKKANLYGGSAPVTSARCSRTLGSVSPVK